MKGNYDFLKNKNNKAIWGSRIKKDVTNYCLELINSKDNIIISGPLINNNDF